MRYCQFQNTEPDFRQCLDAIGNAGSIQDFSAKEQHAAQSIYEMAQEYISWYDQLIDQVEEEDE